MAVNALRRAARPDPKTTHGNGENFATSLAQLDFSPLGQTITAPRIEQAEISAVIASISCLLLPSPCSSNSPARSFSRRNFVPFRWWSNWRTVGVARAIRALLYNDVGYVEADQVLRTQ